MKEHVLEKLEGAEKVVQDLLERVVTLERRTNFFWMPEMGRLAQVTEDLGFRIDDVVARVEPELLAMKESISEILSYRDALLKGAPSLSSMQQPAANGALKEMDHVHSARQRSPACVIKAPRGFIQGQNAAARGQAVNAQVISKLTRQEGHLSLPEATGAVPIRTWEGADYELWLTFFKHEREVEKLFSYKPQIMKVLPAVFVQPSLSVEERAERKQIFSCAQKYIAEQEQPELWRLKWKGCVKGCVLGPDGAVKDIAYRDKTAMIVN